MTPQERALAKHLARVINELIGFRVAKALGHVKHDALHKDPVVREWDRIVSEMYVPPALAAAKRGGAR